jgi:hypothetical protein
MSQLTPRLNDSADFIAIDGFNEDNRASQPALRMPTSDTGYGAMHQPAQLLEDQQQETRQQQQQQQQQPSMATDGRMDNNTDANYPEVTQQQLFLQQQQLQQQHYLQQQLQQQQQHRQMQEQAGLLNPLAFLSIQLHANEKRLRPLGGQDSTRETGFAPSSNPQAVWDNRKRRHAANDVTSATGDPQTLCNLLMPYIAPASTATSEDSASEMYNWKRSAASRPFMAQQSLTDEDQYVLHQYYKAKSSGQNLYLSTADRNNITLSPTDISEYQTGIHRTTPWNENPAFTPLQLNTFKQHDWDGKIFTPFRILVQRKKLGVALRFLRYFPHAPSTIKIPVRIYNILNNIGIGSTLPDISIFVWRDLKYLQDRPTPFSEPKDPDVKRFMDNLIADRIKFLQGQLCDYPN